MDNSRSLTFAPSSQTTEAFIFAIDIFIRKTVELHGELVVSDARYHFYENMLVVSQPIVDVNWKEHAIHKMKTMFENCERCLRLLSVIDLNYTNERIQTICGNDHDVIEILKEIQTEFCFNDVLK
jgi:hypothetical protein